MMHYPVICVDNFYKNPDKVREFALNLDYEKISNGNFPGYRTPLISEVDYDFVDIFSKKIFSLVHERLPDSCKIHTNFQKIYPYSDEYDDIVNNGWIHVDSDDSIFAGVIYLNKNASSDCGTSIYKPYKNFDKSKLSLNFAIRDKLYKNNILSSIDFKEYRRKKQHHESMFEKTIDISNVYNRLVLYDANIWHKESSFCTKSLDEDFRLTQVFFIKDLLITNTPLLRSNTFSL